MAQTNVACRIRVKKTENDDLYGGDAQQTIVLPVKDFADVGVYTRSRWATEIMKHFGQNEKPPASIRPWNYLALLDGSVEINSMSEPEGDVIDGYPPRFQIPPSTLYGLNHEEKVTRAEMFAMAGLLYEIMTGKEPFEELSDDEVQHRFMNGELPDDVATLPVVLFILEGWSAEFSQELRRRSTLYQTVSPLDRF